MTRLVFVGGAPGVGKSTVVAELLRRLDKSVWLDGDDLWRMNPFVIDDVTKGMVERNICFTLRSFIETGFSVVVFTWVLHDQSIADRLRQGIGDAPFSFHHFMLSCDEATLVARLSSRPSGATDTALALRRLRETCALDTTKIDTTGKEPGTIAEEIIQALGA